METLAKRIKKLRTANDLSQAALGKLCKVSRVAVTKWENGDTENLKLANLKRLAAAFNISVAELIDAAEPRTLHVQEPISPSEYTSNIIKMPSDMPLRNELANLVEQINDRGLVLLIESAEQLVARFPRTKANPAS